MKNLLVKHILAAIVAIGCSLASPVLAQDLPWRINFIPLDMPREEALNGEYLEGIFQEKLQPNLVDSIGIDWPSYHIRSTLRPGGANSANDGVDETMELYFSSPADGQRLFWIRAAKPVRGAADPAAIAKTLGFLGDHFAEADRIVTLADSPGSSILVMIDPTLPEAERKRIAAALPNPLQLSPDQFRDFWAMSLKDRAAILGRDFRGGVAILNASEGELRSLQVELLDLKRAQTVFNLDP